MEAFFTWLLQQSIAIVALILGIILLIQYRKLKRQIAPSAKIMGLNTPPEGGYFQIPHLIHHEHDGDRTHVIRNQKLVNHISLYFQNQGAALYYDNIEFEKKNKRQEVEILADKELEIFTDPRDNQKVDMGESLKITFEREIGEAMDYNFKVFFQNKEGKMYYQKITGKKGISPTVSEPIEEALF